MTEKEFSVAMAPNTTMQWNHEMPPTKIKAFLREFPWVRDHVHGPITQVYVSRMDATTLTIMPETYNAGDFFGDRFVPKQHICLLDNDGRLVKVMDREEKYRLFRFWRKSSFHYEKVSGVLSCGESVGTKLDELGADAQRVRFVLWYDPFDAYSPRNRFGALILYKAPKGIPIDEWIERQIDDEVTRYRKTTEEIDAV